MRIPEIREELRNIASSPGNYSTLDLQNRLFKLADELARRKPTRPKKRVHNSMNDAIREAIRNRAATQPELTQVEIAAMYNVSPARVSETLNGRRK